MAPQDTYISSYPRAEDHQADGELVGIAEMMAFTGRTRRAIYKWFERGALPPADGPIVDGRPTWSRALFLGWAWRNLFLRNLGDNSPREAAEEGEAHYRRLGEMRVRSANGHYKTAPPVEEVVARLRPE